MLETVLLHLHNWFEVRGAARYGEHRIVSGAFAPENGVMMEDGQYYRIEGSVFNDGLHMMCERDVLRDEVFTGTITPLAIPKKVIELSKEIETWCKENPVTDKVSESFGGYSYTRGSKNGAAMSGGWQAAFSDRLNAWKKVC
jgi:hypothetical protein